MEGTNVGQISLGLDINKSLFNKQLNGIASGAQKSVTNAFKPIGKLIGGALALGSIVSFTKSCLDLGSNLQEVQNVVDVTFGSMRGKVDEFASTAIDKFGLSETVAKKMMGTYGAMSKSFGFNPQEVYDMSEAITGLTADVASFYNLETDEAYTKMKSIWTGETESLKELGVVMTQTALDQYALNNGFGKTTAAMTEQEKVMLRYQFVQSQLSDASGDFARTSGGWANQIRVLTLRFQQLKATLGQGFINLFTPIIKMINSFIASIQNAANAFLRLTEIITGQESGSLGNMAANVSDISGAAGDASSNISGMGDSAASAAKKAQRALMGFDSINKISEADTSGGSSGGGNTGIGSGGGAIANEFAKANTEASKLEATLTSMVEKVKKAWETGDFTEIGGIIGGKINECLENINWDSIQSGADKISKSFATFLNGFFETPGLFTNVGKTVAEALNTAIGASLSFAENFNFDSAGQAVADAINGFFRNFDSLKFAKSINAWVNGIQEFIVEALKNISWSDILKDGMDFLTNLDLSTVAVTIGAFTWFSGGKEIVAGSLKSLLSSKISTGIGDGTIPLSDAISISITTAIVGFKIGNWIYENTRFSKFADAVAEWMVNENGEVSVSKAITVSLTGLVVSVGASKLLTSAATAVTTALAGEISVTGIKLTLANIAANIATGAEFVWSGLAGMAESLVSSIGTAIGGLSSVGSTIASGIGTALSSAGTFLTSSVSTVFAGGAASIAAGLLAAIGSAIAGWKIGNLIYDKFSEQIDDIVFKVCDFFTKTIPDALSKAGSAVVDFAVNVKGSIDDKAKEIKDWFANKKDEAKNLIANAKDNASSVIDKFKGKWNSITDKAPNLIATAKNNSEKVLNTLKGAWEKIVSNNPLLSASAKNNNSGVLSTLKSSWDAIKKKTATLTAKATNKDSKTLKSIKSAWNSIKSKTAQMTVKFQDSFTKPLKAAWNALAKKVQSAINTINKIPGVNITGKVPTFAKGGFPEEGPFYMNRGEIAGKFSNGKGVVANNAQITTGIANAVGPSVYQAVKSAMAISIPRIRTPQLAVAYGTNEDKTLQRLLDVLTIIAAGGANADMIAMLKEILEFLKTMDRDVYMDGEKVTKIITDIINRTTDITGSCPVHT